MHCHTTHSTAVTALKPARTAPSETDLAPSIADLFDPKQPVRHALPNHSILLEGEPAHTLYQIVSGTVRCCTYSDKGDRQIFRFAGPGDFLGFADFETWHFTAEAVDHVILRSVSRQRAEGAIAKEASLHLALRTMMSRGLAARERHMFALAYASARDRLYQFLTDFAAQRGATDFTVLPMSRCDIADHIGVTFETVSRAFSSLKRLGAIEMRGTDRFRILSDDISLAA